jgi:hypothetical protein
MRVFLVLDDQQITVIWFLVIYHLEWVDLVVFVQGKYIDGDIIVTLKLVNILDGCGEADVFPVVAVLVTDQILYAVSMVGCECGKYSPFEALLVQVTRVDNGLCARNTGWQIQVATGLQYLELVDSQLNTFNFIQRPSASLALMVLNLLTQFTELFLQDMLHRRGVVNWGVRSFKSIGTAFPMHVNKFTLEEKVDLEAELDSQLILKKLQQFGLDRFEEASNACMHRFVDDLVRDEGSETKRNITLKCVKI